MSSPYPLLGTAAGIGEGLKELLARRVLEQKQREANNLEQAKLAEEVRAHQADELLRKQAIEESAATRRSTASEAAQSKREAQNLREVNLAMMMPAGTTVSPERVRTLVQQGMAPEFFDQQAQAFMRAQKPENNIGLGPPTDLMTAPPGSPQVTRFLGKQADLQRQQEETDRNRRAAEAEAARQDNIRLAASLRPSQEESLVRVEHMGPDGRTVVEYLPKSEVRGRIFQKGASGTTEARLASAQAVYQTGNDMINKLSDPTYAAKLGPMLGRYNSVRDFIGNPPPEFSDLAGQIESYALANMGVHGMRSAQGAEQIKKLLDQHHTPQSMIGAIQGLSSFSQHFLENEGRGQSVRSTAKPKPTAHSLIQEELGQ